MAASSSGPVEPGRTYRLSVAQQPTSSAAFHDAYLSRLPLSPPPILLINCEDADGEVVVPYDELPFFVCHLTLETPDGDDATMMQTPEDEIVSMLYGTLVATPVELADLYNANRIFLAFPDVSVKKAGHFRLRATLYRITGGPPLAHVETDVFSIVEWMEYVGPEPTTLTRHLHEQGIVNFGLAQTPAS